MLNYFLPHYSGIAGRECPQPVQNLFYAPLGYSPPSIHFLNQSWQNAYGDHPDNNSSLSNQIGSRNQQSNYFPTGRKRRESCDYEPIASNNAGPRQNSIDVETSPTSSVSDADLVRTMTYLARQESLGLPTAPNHFNHCWFSNFPNYFNTTIKTVNPHPDNYDDHGNSLPQKNAERTCPNNTGTIVNTTMNNNWYDTSSSNQIPPGLPLVAYQAAELIPISLDPIQEEIIIIQKNPEPSSFIIATEPVSYQRVSYEKEPR